MNRISLCTLLGLGVLLTAGVPAAEAGKGTKNSGEHWVFGQVTATQHMKNGATISIQVHHHKKQGSQASNANGKPRVHHANRTFHVHNGTQFAMTHGKQLSPASMAAIHQGSHVGILAQGDRADRVVVRGSNPGQGHPPRAGYYFPHNKSSFRSMKPARRK